MSGIGHFATGFTAKPLVPEVPLIVLLAASETNEILYFIFSSVGIEKPAEYTMDFTQGVRTLTPASNPWSHGFFMSVVWSFFMGAIIYLFYQNRRTAGVVGLVAFSHWVLDFLMHSNLPLFFEGSPQVGLGLENSGSGFIFMTVLDIVLFLGGIIVYLRWRKRLNADNSN